MFWVFVAWLIGLCICIVLVVHYLYLLSEFNTKSPILLKFELDYCVAKTVSPSKAVIEFAIVSDSIGRHRIYDDT